jgi:hypothetical protein
MNLNSEQALDVIRSGISKEILAAFEQRGREVGWRPLQDKAQPKRPWSRHPIDPTPFFPQKPKR